MSTLVCRSRVLKSKCSLPQSIRIFGHRSESGCGILLVEVDAGGDPTHHFQTAFSTLKTIGDFYLTASLYSFLYALCPLFLLAVVTE
jgi:hypothetical protein